MVALLPSACVAAAGFVQAVMARRYDFMPLTTWVAATALLMGLPEGPLWGAWAFGAMCVGVSLWRRRRMSGNRPALLGGVLVAGLGLHAGAASFPTAPMLAWISLCAVGLVVVVGLCVERRHDARQVRWVGEIPIRER